MARNKDKRNVFPDVPPALEVPIVDNHTHFPVRGEAFAEPVLSGEGSGEFGNADTERVPGRGLPLRVPHIVERMGLSGVRAAITCGCEVPTLASTVEVAERYENVFAAIAIHPNDAPLHCGITDVAPDGLEHGLDPHHREYSLDDALALVESYARSPQVVAIGESGLDYFRTAEAGKRAQIDSFKKHIELAKSLDLPLQIHDRQAHDDVVATLLECGAPERTIFHCFSGDGELARICAEHGWYASFAGPVTYPANEDLRQAFLELPSELILLETDAPYLTPVPWRGHPNAAYAVVYTARFLAELRGMSEGAFCEQVDHNTRSVYGI